MTAKFTTKRWQNDVNAMLADMAKKYDNLTLIDWYDYSNGHSDWFYDDQVHPNPEGMKHYIHLVSETLLGKSKTDTKTTKDTTNGNSNTDVSVSESTINE